MTDEPPIINLDVSVSDAAAARTLVKGMLATEGWEYNVELPADPNELGRLVLALAHEAALLAFGFMSIILIRPRSRSLTCSPQTNHAKDCSNFPA